ncbi:hypothetical protein, partial [Azospirillum argentinense]|uniref:hypothetical protein n=1 Tax=Azospirillum argentinense TaxID=2970906 RepID=UPI003556C47C
VLWDAETAERRLSTPEDKAAVVKAVDARIAAIADDAVRAAYAADFAGRLEALLGHRPALASGERRSVEGGARRWAPRPAADLTGAIAAARALWSGRRRLAGTPAGAWLALQGLASAADWPTLGAQEAEYVYAAADAPPVFLGHHPVLVAVMAKWDPAAPKGVSALLVQYLGPDGRPARFSEPATGRQLPNRQVLGAGDGAAVRLGPLTGAELVVATGLGVGVRAQAAQPAVPVWVIDGLRSATRLVVPDAVRKITLVGIDFADVQTLRRAVEHLGRDGRAVHTCYLQARAAAGAAEAVA